VADSPFSKGLLKRLQGLPLALTQAGSYLRATKMSVSDYIKYYDETWNDFIKEQGNFSLQGPSDRTLLATWKMSYDQVRSRSEEAANLLKSWAMLDSTDIWYDLLTSFNTKRFKKFGISAPD
jgi:hypothetical protein